jgi:PKD repeat protein
MPAATPCADEPVNITAHVTDDVGVTWVTLTYDSTTVSMNLTSGDAQDGYWQAMIPGQAAGTTLSLYVTASDGEHTVSSDPHDKTWSEAPVAAFDARPNSGCAPLRVDFTDLSTDNPTSWNWTFGDGDTSTAQNPSHRYTSPGTYTVTLNVTNRCGWDTTVAYITARDCRGGGAAGVEQTCSFDVDMLTEITTVRITCCDSKVIESAVAPDPDDIHFLEFDRGIQVICTDCPACGGNAPEVIVMTLAEEVPPLSESMAMVGPAYNITGYINDSACLVFLSRPITIVFDYDPDEVPQGTTLLAIAYYDEEELKWVFLPPDIGRVAEIGKATGLLDHIGSTFAVIAEITPPSALAAHFVASDLIIVPSVREMWHPVTFVTSTGESATVTATIANNGGQEGTYTVELKIDGQTVDTRDVTLGVGQSQQVSFALSGMDYGRYEVEVAELSGEFAVSRTINWWLIGGIIVALGLITGGVIWGRKRRKAAQGR